MQGHQSPNGSVPQNICSSGTFLLAGRCGRNNSPWKESVAGKKIIQGVRGDLKSRIAATGYLYGLLTAGARPATANVKTFNNTYFQCTCN